MDKCTKGTHSEMIACTWLLQNGYHVFRNIAPVGPIDLVAVKGGQVTLIDVKTVGVYKNTYHLPSLTKEQITAGVKSIAVYPDGNCELDNNPSLSRRGASPMQFSCTWCSNIFESKSKHARYCSPNCRQLYHRAKMAPQKATNARTAV